MGGVGVDGGMTSRHLGMGAAAQESTYETTNKPGHFWVTFVTCCSVCGTKRGYIEYEPGTVSSFCGRKKNVSSRQNMIFSSTYLSVFLAKPNQTFRKVSKKFNANRHKGSLYWI